MSPLHRAGTTIVTSALALTLVSGGVATASPVRTHRAVTPQAASAATWLSHQLTRGLVHNGQYEFDDYGLTADTALALKAVGGHARTVEKIRTALARHVDDYTTFQKSVSAGSVAKLLVVAQQNGASGHGFGGVDLVHRLSQRVITSGPATGRIQDKGADDFANVVGQVLAARGLLAAHNAHADDTLAFLLKQQCSTGFFRQDFTKSTTSGRQSCDAQKNAAAPSSDVTAFAVIQLSPYVAESAKLAGALRSATAWLARHQASNGGIGALGTPTKSDPANANSTGLAGWALGLAGSCDAAGRAAAWIARKQVAGKLAGTPLAGERGAIAYDGAALRTAQKGGITTKTRDQWRRATSQAAPALQYLAGGRCRTA